MGGETTGRFHIASEEDILAGRTTDVYFARMAEILRKEGKDRVDVVAEFTSGSFPQGWPWAVLCGLDEALALLEGRPLDVYALPEGSLFPAEDAQGVRLPVLVVEGPYGPLCVYETPVLGCLCQASGVATKAARVRQAAGEATVIAFGIRRMHPALSPLLDRAAYVGGLDGVSSLAGAETVGQEAQGTMPHALTIVLGSPEAAFRAFDKHADPSVPRVALADTYLDEVAESLIAAEAVPDLAAVRLDTPGSRKGDFPAIVRQVRWELAVRGHEDVEVFVSGGLDEASIPPLVAAGATGFGVGTSVANAPTVNFAMDVVEVEGRPAAKRGKFSGRKEVYRCEEDLTYRVGREAPPCPTCGGPMEPALVQYLKKGEPTRELPAPGEIRDYVLRQLEKAGAPGGPGLRQEG